MRIVLDTNLFWVSITRKSSSNWIFKSLIQSKFELCVSSEILLEYEEIISNRLSPQTADAVLSLLDQLPNVLFVDPYFNWALISADPDDNKFVDCAISAAAKFIVIEHKHFAVLEKI